ncbi:hypothetical protein IWQ61_003192 [Dispira simplex]|nr:hypothetical protein IWQ61_003192 [Dispira simplex]
MTMQFAYRSVKEVGLVTGPPDLHELQGFTKPQGLIRFMTYSPNGSYFAWTSPTAVHIYNVETKTVTREIARPNVVELAFSPLATYLLTWERMVKQEDGSPHQNMVVWNTATGEQVASFSRKTQSNWALQWSADESYCGLLVTNEVRFFDPANFAKGIHCKLQLDGMQSFSLSPGRSPSVAAFVSARKSMPGMVRLYSLGNFRQPLAQKTFFKADKVKMIWNTLGTNVLVWTSTEVDSTGKSYYGETNLYYLTVAGNFDCQVILDKEGPIHDVAWNPDASAKEFAVVYGYMPAKAALFDRRASLVHDFGTAPRNFVQFSPQGRFVAVAGFGNLTGQMDIWDLKHRKKSSSFDASNTTFCQWSPSGRYLLTATCSPRLRVDNGIKVWHHTGVLLYHQPMHELYQVCWQPLPTSKFPDRAALSPPPRGTAVTNDTPKKSTASVGTYRPPHARGTSTPPVLKCTEQMPRSTVPGATFTSNGGGNQSKGADFTKRIRTISRKLKQISELKERQQNGDTLDPKQLEKIANEAKLVTEIEDLKVQRSQCSNGTVPA